MNINIRFNEDEPTTIRINADESLEALKIQVSDDLKILSEESRLIYKIEELENNSKSIKRHILDKDMWEIKMVF